MFSLKCYSVTHLNDFRKLFFFVNLIFQTQSIQIFCEIIDRENKTKTQRQQRTKKNWFCVKVTFVFGKADSMFNHHFASSGHVPLTNVTRSGAVTANEFKWPVTSSAVETSSTFVISMHACGIVSGWNERKKRF